MILRLRRRRLRALGSAIGAVALLGGCTGGAGGVVEITTHYSRFTPAEITVWAGQPVRLSLRNDDPIDHEWIVGDDALHARHRTGSEPAHGDRPTEQTLPALATVRTTVTFDSAGTYRFICHLPGHEAYGMVGTITVRSDS